MDKDFTLGGKSFKLNKINAMKQYHIVRRVAPILGELAPAMKGMMKVSKAALSEDEKFDQFAILVTPLMNGISKLSDADSDKVLLGLLESVEIQQEGQGWARVANNGMLMFDGLDLPTLLQVAGRAFAYNLSGFFEALPKLS